MKTRASSGLIQILRSTLERLGKNEHDDPALSELQAARALKKEEMEAAAQPPVPGEGAEARPERREAAPYAEQAEILEALLGMAEESAARHPKDRELAELVRSLRRKVDDLRSGRLPKTG